jgi:LBP / BPI / CETP family, C-terminal domain
VFDCASLVYFKLGELTATLTPEKLPAKERKLLEVDTYEFIIPELYWKYKNKTLALDISALKAPHMSFSANNGASMAGSVSLNFSVIGGAGNGSANVPVFTLVADFAAAVKVLAQNGPANTTVVSGSLTHIALNLSLASSSVGKIEFYIIDELIHLAADDIVPPLVNAFLADKHVVVHPVDNFFLVNPKVTYGAGFVGLGASVRSTKQP